MNATPTATLPGFPRLGTEPAGFDDPTAEAPDDEACAQGLEAPPAPRTGLASEPQDAELAAWLERVVARDERALTALYDATLPRVYGLVLRIVHSHALAEEVVEDTYFQVWRQAVRYDPTRGRALAWVLAMARSRAIDTLRREARFAHDSLDTDSAPELPANLPPADHLLDAARGNALLLQALQQLAAQPRQLVALAFLRGLSHEEIASQTALPLGTVKSQIRRALITLRQVLGDQAAHALAS